MMHKDEVRQLLRDYKMPELVSEGGKDSGLVRILISLVYDKADLMSWRAIEAIGLISGNIAEKNPDKTRNLSQRFLWMMRDESGNGPGSAPEMLGEIVRSSPDAFSDVGQVLTSFHDEIMLRPGVMRAIWRIIEKRPDLICITDDLMEQKLYLDDDDARVRAYALMIAGKLGLAELRPVIAGLRNDNSIVKIYMDGDFMQISIAEIAGKVYAGLSGRED